MKEIIKSFKLKPLNILISLVLVFAGLIVDLQDNKVIANMLHLNSDLISQIIRVALTFILGLIGFLVLIGAQGFKSLFKNAHKPVKYTILGFILVYVINTIISLIIAKLFKVVPPKNTNIETNLVNSLFSLPFFIFFEEVWTMTMLFIIANLTYKKSKNFDLSFMLGSIISALVFAAFHWSAYYHGNVVFTLVQLLVGISIVRIVLNYLFAKSNTFTVPYLIHLALDTTLFLLSLLMKK